MRALERRLLRLEEQRQAVLKPLVLFAKYDRPDNAIIALRCGQATTQRRTGEALDATLARAAHELHSRLLWAVYAAAHQSDAPMHVPPLDRPMPVVPVEPAIGQPGIGRRATHAELQRWGLLPQR